MVEALYTRLKPNLNVCTQIYTHDAIVIARSYISIQYVKYSFHSFWLVHFDLFDVGLCLTATNFRIEVQMNNTTSKFTLQKVCQT